MERGAIVEDVQPRSINVPIGYTVGPENLSIQKLSIISQGSFATCLRCDGILTNQFIAECVNEKF